MRRTLTWIAAVIVVIGLGLAAAYRIADPEVNTLDETSRRGVPGSFVTLSDGVTHYQLAGPDTGRVVVLAHGSSVPYYIWDSTFVALAATGHRVLRYDYYGRGWSDRPDIPYVPALYVRQLTELLDSLRITAPINLAGLSYGGVVITSFAAVHPDRVRSLIYVDAVTLRPGLGTPLPWYTKVPGVLEWLTTVVVAPTWASGQSGDFLHGDKWPDWPAKYQPQMTYRGFRHARLRAMLDNVHTDQTATLDSVGRHPRPVLVVWGRQDPVVPFSSTVPLMKALPNATLLAVDSAGHLPHLEQAGIVQPAIIAFLKSVP